MESQNNIYAADPKQVKIAEKKLNELFLHCQAYNIPMFGTIAVSDTGETTYYINSAFSAAGHLINLKDDQIRKHMLVANGFEVVPAREKAVAVPYMPDDAGQDISV